MSRYYTLIRDLNLWNKWRIDGEIDKRKWCTHPTSQKSEEPHDAMQASSLDYVGARSRMLRRRVRVRATTEANWCIWKIGKTVNNCVNCGGNLLNY